MANSICVGDRVRWNKWVKRETGWHYGTVKRIESQNENSACIVEDDKSGREQVMFVCFIQKCR